MWIIGIDGGGTKCEAGLFDSSGQLLASALSGPANVFANFDGAIAAIEQASEKLINAFNNHSQTKIDNKLTKKDCFLSLGCAGGGVDLAKKNFQQWQHQYAGAALTTDVHVSCLAANNAEPCALFVIGTGSCLAVYQHEEVKQFGGHGFLLGDIASGAWLGKQAIGWYLQALETPNADSELQNALAPVLGENISDIIEQYGHAISEKFGALVPAILQVKAASPTVNAWLNDGAEYAAGLIIQHAHKDLSVYMTGGLAEVYKPLIEKITSRTIQIPRDSAVYGAYHVGKQYLLHDKASNYAP